MIQDEAFLEILAKLAPGTPLREGLDGITSLGKGALILIADKDHAAHVVQSGFEIDTDFTPQKLTELSKMDRAIVVDHDVRKILYANAFLVPNQKIASKETGTRHLTAEMVAKQIQSPTLAVSASKDRVTLYFGEIRYILPDFNMLTARVNQALHILEQYRSTLDNLLHSLTALELDDRVLSDDVCSVIQLMVQMFKVREDVERWFIELGDEKVFQEQLLEWLMLDVGERFYLILKDYQRKDRKSVIALAKRVVALPPEKLFETDEIMRILGYDDFDEETEFSLTPRGYRILHELPRLPTAIAKRLVSRYGKLSRIVKATEEDLFKIRGIGMVRARMIRAGMHRMQAMYNAIPEER